MKFDHETGGFVLDEIDKARLRITNDFVPANQAKKLIEAVKAINASVNSADYTDLTAEKRYQAARANLGLATYARRAADIIIEHGEFPDLPPRES